MLHAVDMVQVQTCWEVGRHIVKFEQRGQARAENTQARQWYMADASSQNWSTHALERQIGTLYHEFHVLVVVSANHCELQGIS